jgi:uncharacterized protein (TIGR02118 family)
LLSGTAEITKDTEMIVLTILYPAGAPLDFDYYREVHLPLVRQLFGPHGLHSISYYRPVDTSVYQLVAELRFTTMEQLLDARAAHSAAAQSDIARFTKATPVTLVGEEMQV